MQQNSIKQNLQSFLLVVVTIFSFMYINTSHIKASQLTVSGSSANDAVITDASGNIVTGQTLNKYTYYTATYKWSLPSDTIVKSGDTITFTLPNDVEIQVANTKFNVTDEKGNVVGEFAIAKNSSTGVLTFNDYFNKNNIKDIHGTLEIKVNGTQDNEPSNWLLNKSGWLDTQNRPNWTVVFNPESKNLTNVQLKDTLQGNQTFNVNSVQLWYGHVENNQFVAEQKITDPIAQGIVKLSDNNTVMTAKFDKLDKAVQLVYQTNADTSTGQFSLINNINASCDQGSATMTSTIEVGGKATANGTLNSSITSSSSSHCSSSSSSKHPCHPVHPEHPCHPVHPEHPCHPVHPEHPCHPEFPCGSNHFGYINIWEIITNSRFSYDYPNLGFPYGNVWNTLQN